MRRGAGVLAIACAAAAAAVSPAAAAGDVAVDPPMACPDMFALTPALIAPPGTDKNGNGLTCMKPADGIIIWRDDLLKP